jgi:hypothetical protein
LGELLIVQAYREGHERVAHLGDTPTPRPWDLGDLSVNVKAFE